MLERWNPIAEAEQILNDVDRLLAQTKLRAALGFGPRWALAPVKPLIDIYETDDQVVVKALVPGAEPESFDVSLEQNVLTISGQYGYPHDTEEMRRATWYRREIGEGRFTESIALPIPVNPDAVQATVESGVLTLTLPKAEHARAKKIPVQSAAKEVAVS